MNTTTVNVRAALAELENRYNQWDGCTTHARHIHSTIEDATNLLLRNVYILEGMIPVDQENICSVCMTEPLRVTIQPCKHRYCEDCPAKFVAASGPKCPQCRSRIQDIVPNMGVSNFTPVDLHAPRVDDDEELPDYSNVVGHYQVPLPASDDAEDLPEIRGITRHADLLERQAIAARRRLITQIRRNSLHRWQNNLRAAMGRVHLQRQSVSNRQQQS